MEGKDAFLTFHVTHILPYLCLHVIIALGKDFRLFPLYVAIAWPKLEAEVNNERD